MSPASPWPRSPANPAGRARGNATRHSPDAPSAPSKHEILRCSSGANAGQCRRNHNCEYSRSEVPSHSATASSPERGWYPSPLDEQADVQTIDFQTILFLDPTLLQHTLVETAPVAGTVPQYILQLLGDLDEIRLTAARFFEHIHQWMPFISKKRFYDLYLQPSSHSRPDVVLLLLALKLITTFPPAGSRSPRTALYNSTKHFYLEVEGSFSILVLQAGVLVALYELGHGIYPAAFLSIGTCARYAHALGINVSRTVPSRRVLTLVEVEERRRVWWAIVILDRFVAVHRESFVLDTNNKKLCEHRLSRTALCNCRSKIG